MVDKRASGIVSERGINTADFGFVGDQEAAFARGIFRGQHIKGKAESFFEKLRQSAREGLVCRCDADSVRGKGMAEQQHSVALRCCAAETVGLLAAYFFFCVSGKRHSRKPA